MLADSVAKRYRERKALLYHLPARTPSQAAALLQFGYDSRPLGCLGFRDLGFRI